jgi:hypothetical protein
MNMIDLFESAHSAIIVVDVQPEYYDDMRQYRFDIGGLMNLLNSSQRVLMLYNNEEDNLASCKEFWMMHGLRLDNRIQILAKDNAQNQKKLVELLREFSGAAITGGLRDLCFREVTDIMEWNKIPFHIMDEYVYG